MIIRKARASDSQALSELYLRHLTKFPPEETQDMEKWKKLISEFEADDNYHLLVAEENGAVVSSVTLVIIPNLTHNLRPYAVMENVVTHADFRGRGYASALIQRAREIAISAECYKIMLLTGSKKESTLSFYEKNGFDRHSKTAFQMRF